jgi:hypothetical protein
MKRSALSLPEDKRQGVINAIKATKWTLVLYRNLMAACGGKQNK